MMESKEIAKDLLSKKYINVREFHIILKALRGKTELFDTTNISDILNREFNNKHLNEDQIMQILEDCEDAEDANVEMVYNLSDSKSQQSSNPNDPDGIYDSWKDIFRSAIDKK